MGTRYVDQGACIECGKYTHDYCDYCGAYICEDHRVRKHPDVGSKEFIFCKTCAKLNRKPIDPQRRRV